MEFTIRDDRSDHIPVHHDSLSGDQAADFLSVDVTSAEELRAWLLAHHEQEDAVWLITYKKSTPDAYISRDQVLDQLISFGWIDGIRRKLYANRTMQLISPRRAQHWSKTYKDRVEKLLQEDAMHQAGRDSVARSKKSGLWNFMDDVDRLIIPDDLAQSLREMNGAYDFFIDINPSSKRFALRWLKLAKTEKTRTARIKKLTALAVQRKKLPGS